MTIVREKDVLKYLTVPVNSLNDAEYEEAILAMVERQQHGTGMAVNFAATVFKKGVKPNREWTNNRTDFDPVPEPAPAVPVVDPRDAKIAELEALLAASADSKKGSGDTIHLNKK